MPGRIIAIGDIHGCAAALDALLAAIDVTADDTIITLGDYVDRGPDSKGVVDRLIALGKKCTLIALQGNHEEMMLDVVKDNKPHLQWLQHGGVDTLDSYGFVGDVDIVPSDHLEFFDSMVDYYESDNHLFFHANYDPDQALSEMDVFTLRWKKLGQQTPGPHMSGKRAVLGHTHDIGGEVFDLGHLICIDTHCYGDGWLTALEVDSGKLWQANQEGVVR